MAKITKTNATSYTIILDSGLIGGEIEKVDTELFAGGGVINLLIAANPTVDGASTYDITAIYGQYNGSAILSLLTKGSTSPLTVSVNNYIDVNSTLSSFLPVVNPVGNPVGNFYKNSSAIGFNTTAGTNYYLYNLAIVDADPITGEPMDIQANLEVLPKNGPTYAYWYDNYKTTTLQSSLTAYFQGTLLADTITGTFAADLIVGGAGNDAINGAGGNDTIDGGLGNDAMTGGLGDDTYYVDAAKDKINENSKQGVDTVISSSSYTLGSNVENLTLTGTTGLSAKGNTLANVLIGSSGNDTIIGDLGADTLTGGIGNDTFVFNTKLGPANIDTITDFTSGDKIALSGSIFSKLKGDKDLSDNLYVQTIVGISTQDNNDYLFYDFESGRLYYDADGSGTKSKSIEVAIIGTGGISLTANDLSIV